MATIEKIQPTHVIDEGRQILNTNDANLNNDISNLSNQLNTHNHDDRYYTKSQVDAIKKKSIITLNLQASTVGTWAKIGNVSMSANFGIVMPVGGNIVDMIAIKSDGQIPVSKNGFPLAFIAGDIISVAYTQYSTSDVIRIYKNGVATDSFVMTKDGQGYGPGLGNYIVELIIEI